MSMLKDQNFKGCNSLLREFIDAVSIEGNDELKRKKERAILALHHLEKITGGFDESAVICGPRPRIPETESAVICGPRPRIPETEIAAICGPRPRIPE